MSATWTALALYGALSRGNRLMRHGVYALAAVGAQSLLTSTDAAEAADARESE